MHRVSIRLFVNGAPAPGVTTGSNVSKSLFGLGNAPGVGTGGR